MSLLTSLALGAGLALSPATAQPAIEPAPLVQLVQDRETRRQQRRAQRLLHREQCRREIAGSGLRGPARAFAVRQCVLRRIGRL